MRAGSAIGETGGFGALEDVACPTTTYCIAVGHDYIGHAVAKRWARSKWTWLTTAKIADVGASELRSVSCVSASNCIAVGYYASFTKGYRTLAEHWNGSKWTKMSTPTPKPNGGVSLLGVACIRAKNCTAVGGYQYTNTTPATKPLAEHWNGVKWSLVPTHDPQGNLSDVACTGSANCTAVGTEIEHWNGTHWSSISTPMPQGAKEPVVLGGVSCVNAANCSAVGNDDYERWDGVHWTVELMPHPVSQYGAVFEAILSSVACTSRSNCNAVGATDALVGTLAEHWNGATWAVVTTPPLPGTDTLGASFYGIACPSATRCIAVGGGSADFALAEIWNGSTWKLMPPVPH